MLIGDPHELLCHSQFHSLGATIANIKLIINSKIFVKSNIS